MAYTNANGQTRVGVRISNSPLVTPTISASLLQSLFGVWNGEVDENLNSVAQSRVPKIFRSSKKIIMMSR